MNRFEKPLNDLSGLSTALSSAYKELNKHRTSLMQEGHADILNTADEIVNGILENKTVEEMEEMKDKATAKFEKYDNNPTK